MTGKHIWVHISFWYMCCFMGFEETTHINSMFNRSRVCRSYRHCMSSFFNDKNVKRPIIEPTRTNNYSAISLSKNHVFHKKTKHIDTRYHFIRELVNNKEICLEFCRSEDQLADIFTKPLARDTF